MSKNTYEAHYLDKDGDVIDTSAIFSTYKDAVRAAKEFIGDSSHITADILERSVVAKVSMSTRTTVNFSVKKVK